MGLFSGNSSIEQAVDAATDARKSKEDWQEILEIVDQIELQPYGAKEALRGILKRIKHKDPHVGLLALTLLDACVVNAKKKFHLEVASRIFDEEVRAMFKNSQMFSRDILEKFAVMLKKWSENEFKSDPALSLIPALWTHIRTTRPEYISQVPVVTGKATGSSTGLSSSTVSKPDAASIQRKEEDDFAKAIALSLEEDNKKKRSSSLNNSTSASASAGSLYPSVTPNAGSVNNNNVIYSTIKKEPRRVRAMYDFEAVEENELTFKAGEILHVIDDSDPNWWKGSNHRGEGLFPTNFITSDLNWEAENDFTTLKKKTNDETSADATITELKPVTINEAQIDKTLNVIHDADPEGNRLDPAELLDLEDQCSRMWPLVDAELQKTDKLQSALEDISTQINDALAMYDTVMKEQAAQMPPAMAYQPQVDHSKPPVHYSQFPQGPPSQFPQGTMVYQQNYSEQQHPGSYPVYPGMSSMQIPSMQIPPQQTFQPYSPNQTKLASAQAGGMAPSQFAQQQQATNSYPSQPSQNPYPNYPQQPPQQ